MPLKNAAAVTKQLQAAFGSDPHSTGPQQQGRLPGSLNAKPGKSCLVNVLHQSVTDICHEVLLRVTPRTQLRVESGSIVASQKPSKLPSGTAAIDRSREDWRLACQYFEANPDSSVEEATKFLTGQPLKYKTFFFGRVPCIESLYIIRQYIGLVNIRLVFSSSYYDTTSRVNSHYKNMLLSYHTC